MDLPEITEVKRFTLGPGDKLVIRTARQPNEQEAHEIGEQVRAIFGVPVLVLGLDTDLEVLEVT